MELHQLLPPQPSSARAARRFAADALRECRQEALTDITTLLVSELVTNALLHTGSQIGVRVRLSGSVLRVEVQDGSPVLPLTPSYDDDATTGRGLEMVELLAADWGVEPLPRGKVVWFDLPAAGASDAQPERHDAGREHAESTANVGATPQLDIELHPVRLLGAPVRLCRATQQHVDALLRERMLIGLAGSAPAEASAETAASALLAALNRQLQPELEVAGANGAATVDVTVQLPPEALSESHQLGAHLDEADDLARAGALLIPAALPEIRACRHWILNQIAAQGAGGAPTAWREFAAADHPSRDLWTLVEHTPILDQLGDAVIVADDENRIVHANPAVERLLGWRRRELVGRRVTTIIPERLREAHVAGYSRYLVTAQPRLLRRPARLPAQHRDGTEVPVELLLTTFRSPDGRPAFVGALRDLRERDVDAAHEPPAIRAARALHDMFATAGAADGGDPGAIEGALLEALGRALDWQFGAVWVDDGGAGLRCAHTWEDEPGRYRRFGERTRQLRLGYADGLPGRVWQSGEVAWVSDVAAHAGYVRSASALEHGLRAGAAFPIRVKERVVAVVELYSARTLDADDALMTVLRTVGTVTGVLAAKA